MRTIFLSALIIFSNPQISKAQWIQQNSGTNQNLYDIEFINDKTGWAVGDAGVIIKTTNSGINWLNVPNPSGQYGGLLWSVCPVDSEVVYVVAGYDFIMKTSNGGTNWNVLSARPNSITGFQGVFFLNRDTGWFLGGYKVFRTYNGGNTLDSFYAPWFTNSDIYFKDINTGIFCGDGRVFKSTDGGINWFNTNVPTGTFYMFRKLAVIEDFIWVADGIVFKSTNFGEDWTIPNPDQNVAGSAITFINKDTGFAGGGGNKLYKTFNGGTNWFRQITDPTTLAFISSIDFANDSTGWYSGGIGKIYKTTSGGSNITSITNTSLNTSADFILYQNYPNPFNPNTIISYQLNEIANIGIEITNVLGHRLKLITENNKPPGFYNLKFEGNNLSTGVYFCFMKVDGNVVDIKKLILIK